jgi:hypothetical protein
MNQHKPNTELSKAFFMRIGFGIDVSQLALSSAVAVKRGCLHCHHFKKTSGGRHNPRNTYRAVSTVPTSFFKVVTVHPPSFEHCPHCLHCFFIRSPVKFLFIFTCTWLYVLYFYFIPYIMFFRALYFVGCRLLRVQYLACVGSFM